MDRQGLVRTVRCDDDLRDAPVLPRSVRQRGGARLPLSWAVTAFDEADALGLVRDTYCPGAELPSPDESEELSPAVIQERIANVDYGVPVVRGIWYPHLNNP